MQKKPFSVLYVLLIPLFLFCGSLPSDPAKDPSNARVKILTVNNDASAEPVKVNAGDSVKLGVQLLLPDYINQIAVALESETEDTVFR